MIKLKYLFVLPLHFESVVNIINKIYYVAFILLFLLHMLIAYYGVKSVLTFRSPNVVFCSVLLVYKSNIHVTNYYLCQYQVLIK